LIDTGASRRRRGESRELSQRTGPGFHREPWIPAFAGMTILIKGQFMNRHYLLISDSSKVTCPNRLRGDLPSEDSPVL